VTASGPVSARIAAELGDGLFATEPDGDLVSSWQNLGGSGSAYAEMPLAWAADEDKAAQAVLEKKPVRADWLEGHGRVANPVNFEAATASITADQVKSQFACDPDAGHHLEVARQFVMSAFPVMLGNGGSVVNAIAAGTIATPATCPDSSKGRPSWRARAVTAASSPAAASSPNDVR
jgi:hypothetical protein